LLLNLKIIIFASDLSALIKLILLIQPVHEIETV